jgi:hypothetical protein
MKSNSRIGEIILFLNRAKSRGARLNGKSVFEKELQSIIDAPEVVCPPTNPGIIGQEPPKVYEEQFSLTK